MRSIVIIIAILLAACSGADAEFLAQPESVADDGGMRIKDIANAVAVASACAGCADGCGCSDSDQQSAQGAAVELDTGERLCFRIPTELDERLPGLRAAAYDAAGAWGVSISLDESCGSWFTIADELTQDERTSEALLMSDGTHRIRFLRSAITSGRIVGSVEQCGTVQIDGVGLVEQTPVVRILLHEFGHVLGLRHSEDSAVMSARQSSGCSVDWPTKIDKSSLVSTVD